MRQNARLAYLLPALVCLALLPVMGSRPAAAQGGGGPHGSLDIACESCHTLDSWTELREPMSFDHAEVTGFDLSYQHGVAECRDCHERLVFAQVPSACADCHADPHQATLGADCQSCHSIAGWSNRGQLFERHDATLFALTGAHTRLDCVECHRGEPPLDFVGTPTDCLSCHLEDYQATTRPSHVRVGFPTTCEECHGTTAWDEALFGGGPDFDHAVFFALTGAHQAADCGLCHAGGRFAGTPTDCFSCHQQEYSATTSPGHAAAGFPTDCETCHQTSSWQGAVLDHGSFFALEGGHRGLDCDACHGDGVYAGTPTECRSCHRADYNATTDPPHAAAGFSRDCESCHDVNGWQGAKFDHDFYRLVGAHRRADCVSCHVDGVYAGTSTRCNACHRADYDATTDPSHAAAGFPRDCESCHDPRGWEGADFDHDRAFQLTGAHRSLDCDSCHRGGVFEGTPRDCYSCHRSDYEATRDPNHIALGFSRKCESCHNTRGWDGADFDHDSFFRLTGAHRGLDCDSCHAGGVFAGTPRDCYSCHRSDYEATTNPNHATAGFPTNCESCHSTSRWEGATFDHDRFFPISSGDHRGLDCSECHVVQGNFQIFECIECHEHRRSETDDEHDDVGGYVWESSACYSCHPTGRE